MINSLFSSFEPYNLFAPSLYLTLIIILYLSSIQEGKRLIFINTIKNSMNKELKPISENKSFNQMIINLFILILFINLFSLTPFSFTTNSLASTVIPTSITLFVIIIIIKSKRNLKKVLIHLTPHGRPLPLSPILTIIELTRLIIRPITISIRLITNIIAGHLIIHLANKLTITKLYLIIPIIPTSSILLLIEVGIRAIQAYIFCILISIYINE